MTKSSVGTTKSSVGTKKALARVTAMMAKAVKEDLKCVVVLLGLIELRVF
jgi:phenylpyruvate tautomerase PptA (4-oxalocrotonate tautomerase family)